MLVLSDCPERLAELAWVMSWSEQRVGSRPPAERALWRALGGGDRLWCADGPDPGPPGFWSHLVVLREAPASQFDALREHLARGWNPPSPVACAALSGRGFHGQRGRPWASDPGNLHLCAAFPEPGIPAGHLASLPMLPAVATVEAVRATGGEGLRPGVKWVNDVLLDGRKIGGVLTASQTQGDQVASLLVGIGLNVATTPAVAPTPFVPLVGCLAEAGSPVTWAAACSAVLAALGRRMAELVRDGPATLLDAYRDASLVLGREVCVFEDPGEPDAAAGGRPSLLARGVVRAITADLALVLEGIERPVTRGRLAFAELLDRSGR